MKIKIKGEDWNINFIDIIDNDFSIYGQCKFNEKLILLRKGLRLNILLETIAHEIYHATLRECGLRDESVDEDLVNWFSYNFQEVNNNVFKIFAKAKEEK